MMFIPIIGAGGNSGSQVTTTITRALALDEIRGRDTLAVLGKRTPCCPHDRSKSRARWIPSRPCPHPNRLELWLGTQRGLSVCFAVHRPLGSNGGKRSPHRREKLGIDPAVMSAPFITTFVDATGLIIYFQIALTMLNK
ncbi:MAG: magnesium transporter [Fimbriimonadaceae bacterium]